MKKPTENRFAYSAKRTKAHVPRIAAACLALAVLAVVFSAVQPPQNVPALGNAATQGASGATADPTAAVQSGELGQDAVVPANNAADRESSQLPVVSNGEDGIAAEHEAGVILVKLPEGTSAASVNEAMAQFDFLAPQAVSADDAVFGWVEMALVEGARMPDAIDALEASGFVDAAQPNYVYHLVDDRPAVEQPGGSLQPGQLNGDFPPKYTPGGASYDMHDYFTFVDDAKANNQTALFTTKLKEAYDYLFRLGRVSETGTDKDAGPLTWASWNDGGDKARPTVAVLDTGCDLGHPDLAANIVDPYDATEAPQGFKDIDGHGTHVCGIVAAEMNNKIGIVGTSFNARVMPVNVFVFDTEKRDVFADSRDIAKGYAYVLEKADALNVRVINLSLGSKTEEADADDKLFLEAIDKAYRKDILTVIASGNEGGTGAYTDFPADFTPNAVSVIDCDIAAVEENAELPWGLRITQARVDYSNYNKEGTIAKQVGALGNLVLSTTRQEDGEAYGTKSGTSMAAPCTAGIAALALQVDPSLNVEQLRSLLFSTADDIAASPAGANSRDPVTPGFDVYTGFGTVNAYRVAKAAVEHRYLSVVEGGATMTLVLQAGSAANAANSVKFAAPEGATGVVWASSAPDVAEVSGGLVTAKGAGQAIISASYTVPGEGGEPDESVELYSTVTVIDPAITGPGSLACNGTAELHVDANTIAGAWRWSSENGNVSVGEWTGVVTGVVPNSSAVVTATLDSNPDIKVSKTVNVAKVNVADAANVSISLSSTSFTATGAAIRPDVTVKAKIGGAWKTLAKDANYTVAYSDNIKPGTGKVTVTGKGDYSGTSTKTFTIKAASTNSAGASESSPVSSSSNSSGNAASPVAPEGAKRLFGDRALDTMKKIVDEGWSGKRGGAVVLTTVDGYWDALTAAGIAGIMGAPVLMTDGWSLSDQTRSVIEELAPATIVVCGGEAAVGEGVAQAASEASGGAGVVRCAGTTATGTAVDVFGKAASLGQGTWSSAAFICTNDGYWDALAAAPISYARAMPIFLTEGRSWISDETIAAMQAGGVKSVYIVGGEAAINDAVRARIEDAGISVAARLWGDTAVETSERVAEFGLSQRMSCAAMGVATTNGYWDALAGAPLCGMKDSVLVLAGNAEAHSISGFVAAHKAQVATCYIFGGEDALDAATYQALQGAIR